MDTEIYLYQAGQILRGSLLGNDVYFQTGFLYPYFLAVLRLLFGTDLLAVQVVQVVIDSFSAVLLSLLSRRFFGAPSGLIAGLGYALYGPFIAGSTQLLIDLPILFPLFAGLVLYFRGVDLQKPILIALAGFLLGISLVTRPYLLPLVVLPPITALVNTKNSDFSIRLKSALLVSFTILLILAAVAVRNRVVGNEWVLTSAGGGWVFFLGNNPDATGGFYIPEGLGIDENPYRYAKSTLTYPSRELGHTLTWSEGSHYWFRKGLSYWQENPWGALSVTLKKIGLCFNDFEVVDNYDYNYLKLKIPWLHLPWLGFGLIAPFGLLGMFFQRNRIVELIFPYAIVFLVAFSQIAILVYTRHRYVLAAMLILFGSSFVMTIWNMWRLRQLQQVGISIVFLVLLIIFTFRNPGMTDARFKSALNLANGLWNAGRVVEAVNAYEEVLELNPNSQEGARDYAISLASIGYISRSREILVDMIDRTSFYPQGHQLLMELFQGEKPKGLAGRDGMVSGAIGSQNDSIELIDSYFRERRFLEARNLARSAYNRFPKSAAIVGQLAYAEDHLGNFKEAADLYREAAKLAPSQSNWAARENLMLGFTALMMKDLLAAEKGFRDALALNNELAEVYYGLGVVLKKRGKRSEAIAAYQKSIECAKPFDRWVDRAREEMHDLQSPGR